MLISSSVDDYLLMVEKETKSSANYLVDKHLELEPHVNARGRQQPNNFDLYYYYINNEPMNYIYIYI